jgi:hypothetical protein
MKRLSSVTVILLVSLFVYTGAAQAGVGVRVWGGIGHINYGNYNDWADAVNAEILAGTGYEFDNMNWVSEFGGEVLVTVIPMLDIGVGAGMLLSSTEYEISGGGVSYSQKHKLRSNPITLSGYLKPPLPFSFAKPIVFGGVGFYYTKLTWNEILIGSPEDYTYEAELTKTGFGLHGGAGLEFSVFPMVLLDIGVKARWAKIKGFEGTGTHSVEGETNLFLAYDKDDLYYGPKDVANPDNYDEGEVDLSGFGFVIGIKVMF